MPGAAVDRRVGADIDIVADDDPPELRDLDRAFRDRARSRTRPGRCARPGCSTTRAPIRQWLSVTLAPTRQSSPSSTAGRDHRIRADPAARAETSAGLDDDMGADLAIVRNGRGRIDDRARARVRAAARLRDRRPARRARMPCTARARPGAPSPAGALSAQPLVDESRAGARAGKGVGVFAVVEKGQVVGTGGFEWRDIASISRPPSAGSSKPGAAQFGKGVRGCTVRPDRRSGGPPLPLAPYGRRAATASSSAWLSAAAAGCASALAGVSAAKLTVSVGSCSSSFCQHLVGHVETLVEQHQLAALEHQIGFSLLGDFGDDLQHRRSVCFRAPRHWIFPAFGVWPARCGRAR